MILTNTHLTKLLPNICVVLLYEYFSHKNNTYQSTFPRFQLLLNFILFIILFNSAKPFFHHLKSFSIVTTSYLFLSTIWSRIILKIIE